MSKKWKFHDPMPGNKDSTRCGKWVASEVGGSFLAESAASVDCAKCLKIRENKKKETKP